MKQSNWVGWAQSLLIMLAIGIVVSFFLTAMGGGKSKDTPVTPTPMEQTPPPVDPNGPQPGVPTVPVAKHEMWPKETNEDADRQLGVEASSPSVTLPDALSQDLTGYWTQVVKWAKCDENLCATVKVPLDWEKPGTAALEIALLKVPSAEPKFGPLFVNPGGPGFGGTSMAKSLGRDHWKGYDIVGWDPRGTGDSTTVECGTTEETDAAYELDGSPDDAAEEKALDEGWAKFAKECRDASGQLLDHLTTIENDRDLDLIRHLLGAEKLNYFGVSYGTYVGAMYAELFPDRVGRMVLDSAVDITNDENSPSQSEGFELALRNYATWCAGMERCTLGNTVDEVITTIKDFVSGLDAKPIKVGNRLLTQGLATTGIALFLYANEEAYPALTYTVIDAMEGRGADLLKAADNLNGRGENAYETVALAFPATRCADWPDQGIREAYKSWDEIKAKSPVFATNMGLDLVCERWTAASAPQLKITGKGAPPIIVVGTTGDSATPYEHAVSMAEQLESGHLVTFKGAGHGSVIGDNPCLTSTVNDYFESGKVPEDGKTCS